LTEQDWQELDDEDVSEYLRTEGIYLPAAFAFAPVMERMTTYENGDRLPNICISQGVRDKDGRFCGRRPDIKYDPAADLDGEDALFYGGGFYDEAMGLMSPDAHTERIDCFRSTEVLYRHAVGQGNAIAALCLGYVYYYDRAEGQYWPLPTGDTPFPTERRAYECFKAAADAGYAEAFYKLGDCVKHGKGCEQDERRAFELYCAAADHDNQNEPHLTGSIELRLASALEEGMGCGHDFKRALEHYERAEAFLDTAVKLGDYYYKRALQGARDGIVRCKQELTLEKNLV
jgi:hypothetical protein